MSQIHTKSKLIEGRIRIWPKINTKSKLIEYRIRTWPHIHVIQQSSASTRVDIIGKREENVASNYEIE